MGTKEAVVQRINQLCIGKGLSLNALANLAGVSPSTVYSLMDSRRKDVSILTIKKLCDGLDITITEFFDDDIFRNLEQEIF